MKSIQNRRAFPHNIANLSLLVRCMSSQFLLWLLDSASDDKKHRPTFPAFLARFFRSRLMGNDGGCRNVPPEFLYALSSPSYPSLVFRSSVDDLQRRLANEQIPDYFLRRSRPLVYFIRRFLIGIGPISIIERKKVNSVRWRFTEHMLQYRMRSRNISLIFAWLNISDGITFFQVLINLYLTFDT